VQLIFLYGPPAVGKLTIAKELSRLTGIPLVDNHSMVDPIAKVLGWGHPEQKRLADEVRLQLFKAAAASDKSLITTFGGGGVTYDKFIQATLKTVTDAGGQVVFVHLVAPENILLKRVGSLSRKDKFTMTDEAILREKFATTPDIFTAALVADHLEIDTSLHTAEESAEIIVEHLKKNL
jgi:shikimate kinase